MEIISIEKYEDRGLLRERITYVNQDGLTRLADTHCAITGQPLATSYPRAVWHCHYHGHYSRESNEMIGKLSKDIITYADFESWRLGCTQYPAEQETWLV